ncbi:hypothetical protein DLJ54_09275 [Corynebacterium heidelbergense]|uniref:Uncharacterized protein n=1 Tax=Corynebacterium heidelbergense TaxID=2055947 RepID=A0A364V3R8_9CORY|nr:hypothetical protein [Corynebacterium heidelbergense]RAV31268.1 hypothetical protein DLJ54_09275 [Corynebacterium heidelbergense]
MAGFLNRIAGAITPNRRSKHVQSDETAPPQRVGGVGANTTYEAAERTASPLNNYMTRLMAQELPMLDSTSRRRVNEILREYTGPTIESVEDLPEEVREIMELR